MRARGTAASQVFISNVTATEGPPLSLASGRSNILDPCSQKHSRKISRKLPSLGARLSKATQCNAPCSTRVSARCPAFLPVSYRYAAPSYTHEQSLTRMKKASRYRLSSLRGNFLASKINDEAVYLSHHGCARAGLLKQPLASTFARCSSSYKQHHIHRQPLNSLLDRHTQLHPAALVPLQQYHITSSIKHSSVVVAVAAPARCPPERWVDQFNSRAASASPATSNSNSPTTAYSISYDYPALLQRNVTLEIFPWQ